MVELLDSLVDENPFFGNLLIGLISSLLAATSTAVVGRVVFNSGSRVELSGGVALPGDGVGSGVRLPIAGLNDVLSRVVLTALPVSWMALGIVTSWRIGLGVAALAVSGGLTMSAVQQFVKGDFADHSIAWTGLVGSYVGLFVIGLIGTDPNHDDLRFLWLPEATADIAPGFYAAIVFAVVAAILIATGLAGNFSSGEEIVVVIGHGLVYLAFALAAALDESWLANVAPVGYIFFTAAIVDQDN